MNRFHPSLRFLVATAVAALVLVGCSGEKRPDPTSVSLELAASEMVNPDRNGRPSPVLVRVYELRSSGTFNTADFFTLLEQDQLVLGAEMVNRWEFQLDPGETAQLETEFQPFSTALGVMVAYREIERARWRAVSPVALESSNAMQAQVGELEVNLQPR